MPRVRVKVSLWVAADLINSCMRATGSTAARVSTPSGNRALQLQRTPVRAGGQGPQGYTVVSRQQQHQHQQQQQHTRTPQRVYANGAGAAAASQHAHKEEAPVDEDEVGHFQVQVGAPIDMNEPFRNGRYNVVRLLGSGTYGKVVEAEDNKYNKTHVAIKLVRREPPLYRVSAKNEIAILRELDGRFGTLKLLREFDHLGHVCMSFELLGDHLSDVLKQNGKPFSLASVRDVSFQLLQAIDYVHSKQIIHTDLKAENILLMSNPAGALSVRVADFGSALYATAWHPPLVGTMHYRSPEAVLQAGWSFPLDVWAIACLIIELCIGQHVFELAHDDVHLAMMERLLGPLPQSLLNKGYAQRNQYNAALIQRDPTGRVRLSPMRNEGHAMVKKIRALEHIIPDRVLTDLLRKMLEYEPDTRVTAKDALMHSFFDLDDEDGGIDSCNASPDISPAAVDIEEAPPHMNLNHYAPQFHDTQVQDDLFKMQQRPQVSRAAVPAPRAPEPETQQMYEHHAVYQDQLRDFRGQVQQPQLQEHARVSSRQTGGTPAQGRPAVTRITLEDQKTAASLGLSIFDRDNRVGEPNMEELSFDQRLAAAQDRIAAYGLLLEENEAVGLQRNARANG